MPFRSKAQQRFMFARHPKMAKRWAKHTPNMKDLPDKVERVELDQLPGGLAVGMSPSDFDQEKLMQGIHVELEHTSDILMAMEIAMDHLTEDPDYYDKLKTIESPSMKELFAVINHDESEDDVPDDIPDENQPKHPLSFGMGGMRIGR